MKKGSKFVGKAKLTTQGQLTLPLEARKDLDIKDGAELYWYEVGGMLVALPKLISLEELARKVKK